MSGMDRWEVRHDLYEDVEVEAEDRLRAIIAAAKIWGQVKEAGAYGGAGTI